VCVCEIFGSKLYIIIFKLYLSVQYTEPSATSKIQMEAYNGKQKGQVDEESEDVGSKLWSVSV